MMRYRGSSSKVIIAMTYVNGFLDDRQSSFVDHYSKSQFMCKYADVPLGTIVNEASLHTAIREVEILDWTPWNRCYSKAIAVAKGDGKIRLNRFKLNRDVSSIVNTLIHELVHVVDHHEEWSAGHNGNSPLGKGRTAPYLIGELAEIFYKTGRLLSDEEIDY